MKIVLSKKKIYTFILLLPLICTADSIVGSKHDLSVTNFYNVKGDSSNRVCIFCHTPHSANSDLVDADGVKAPIWNRRISNMSAFVLYDESPGTPSSVSLACLSCHDGVNAQGRTSAVDAGATHNVINAAGSGLTGPNGGENPNCGACHPFSRPKGGGLYPATTWQIGADLTDDHPISINYAASFAHRPGEFLAQPINGLKLFNGKVECASCHNVHDNANGLFLRTSNTSSGVCKSCHVK